MARFIPVDSALEMWIADARGRKVKEPSITKMRQLKDSLIAFCALKDVDLVSNITVEEMREFRRGWSDDSAAPVFRDAAGRLCHAQ